MSEDMNGDEIWFTVRPAQEWSAKGQVFVTPDDAEKALRTMVRNAMGDACSVPWPDEWRKAEFVTRTASEIDALLLPHLAREFALVLNDYVNKCLAHAPPTRLVLEPNMPKKTRVTKHDAQGRILEFETTYT